MFVVLRKQQSGTSILIAQNTVTAYLIQVTKIYFLRVNRQFVNSLPVLESGVDAGVTSKFPGSAVVVGSAASGAGDNREIPVEEGGDIDKKGR